MGGSGSGVEFVLWFLMTLCVCGEHLFIHLHGWPYEMPKVLGRYGRLGSMDVLFGIEHALIQGETLTIQDRANAEVKSKKSAACGASGTSCRTVPGARSEPTAPATPDIVMSLSSAG